MRIKKLKTNSKEIKNGDVFVCALGNIDKTQYVGEAVKNGCCLVLSEKKVICKVPNILINNLNNELKKILDRYYDFPLRRLNLIGVTGTDGKTTVTSILKDMTNDCAIGTNGMCIDNRCLPLNNTTPSLDKIYECFNKSLKCKKKNIFMEVSSEAYLTNRIPNLYFDIGVFTNITKDHLDKHKTFKNYFDCKMELFKNSCCVILNHDDKYFNKIKKVNSNYKTYGFKKSDLTIKKYREYLDKTYICFNYNNQDYDIISPLIGKYNVYNLMACILVLLELNYEIDDIIKKINLIKTINGRNEVLYNKDFMVMIDHAHTENATKNILKLMNKVKNSRLIVVLGCAGGRYKEKRNVIGKIALKYADIVIFTMDDPRDEKVEDIIEQMLENNASSIKNYYKIIDRKEAIKKAIDIALKDDIVLILGRGRDRIMHMNNYDVIHSDYDVIRNLLYKNKQ